MVVQPDGRWHIWTMRLSHHVVTVAVVLIMVQLGVDYYQTLIGIDYDHAPGSVWRPSGGGGGRGDFCRR